MKATYAILLIIVGITFGYLIRMWVHPRMEVGKKHPGKTVAAKTAQQETRRFMTGKADPARAVLITGDFLSMLHHLRDSIKSDGLRIYFATDQKGPGYNRFIIVGTDKYGNDLIQIPKAPPYQGAQVLGDESSEESKSTEATEVLKSAKYDVRICPKMCDDESPLMPQPG
jgi:hypothetical protein